MLTLILRRLGTAIPTLFVVILLSFLLMRLAPGGPFDGERPLDPATRAALTSAYGLDLPLHEQFLRYIGNLAQGDFGPSPGSANTVSITTAPVSNPAAAGPM